MAILLAYSGGLDTSFCVPFLKEEYGEPVITITVNTGGVDPAEAEAIEARSLELGAERHILLDGRSRLFEDHLKYLVMGNVLRGNVYPLCVGPERVVQARLIVEEADKLGARAVAHGSTGAGNDQVRFDVALRILAGDLEVITPIRERGLSRADTTAYLKERGFDVPASITTYSINAGLWGTTIGGRETLDSREPVPDEAYPATVSPAEAPDQARAMALTFEAGVPVAVDGESMDPVTLIEWLNREAGAHGIGRAIHVGDTILGIKGRVAFEAPAPAVLITAHRELEKVVLSKWQQFQKSQLADFYGMLLHEGQYFDPVMRDIEAFLESSQVPVSGTVQVRLHKGRIDVLGCESPHSMFDANVATYGETNELWDGRDARGFARIAAVHALLARTAREDA
ncbi:MAG: argininosuccinate synthase [Rhodothermales bacterium]|nr:argininosuccinate synthase [Rhodothermales bacterium]MBO6779374.1 argininosuccinate synthase [Rhodothermales bacterium]